MFCKFSRSLGIVRLLSVQLFFVATLLESLAPELLLEDADARVVELLLEDDDVGLHTELSPCTASNASLISEMGTVKSSWFLVFMSYAAMRAARQEK